MHFDMYIKDPPAKNEVFGQETLTGIWNLLYKLHITKDAYLAHEEYRYITGNDYGNVYTLFRRFIQDFGIVGMILASGMLSLFFSVFYNQKIKYKNLNEKCFILVVVYCYMYHIIAMASVDNLIQDYLSAGTMILFVILLIMWKFLLRNNKSLVYVRGRVKNWRGLLK